VRNAFNDGVIRELTEAFSTLGADPLLRCITLGGRGKAFCAGADLKAVSQGPASNPIVPVPVGEAADPLDPNGPMGPTRLVLSKPVIAAVEGHAVAGGMELACWADLRVVAEDAVFGIFCRRWGVPLIDGGTVRLPRLIGQSHAMDLILTGRPVGAAEAFAMGLANRIVPKGTARDAAERLAAEIAVFPQVCMRNDRLGVLRQWDAPYADAIAEEFRLGLDSLKAGAREGAARFASGKGRGGRFDGG